MMHSQIDTIRWPVLFISSDNAFFHVAINRGTTTRHAFGDIKKWLGADAALTEIDLFGRDRRRLQIVSGAGGLSVRRHFDAEPVPEETLLSRINAVLQLLETARAADPELTEETIPLPVDGYAAYLDQIAGLLLSAPADHETSPGTPSAGPIRGAARPGPTSTAIQVGQAFLAANPSLARPGTAQPAAGAADLPLGQAQHPAQHPRGWLHNLMHQAWG